MAEIDNTLFLTRIQERIDKLERGHSGSSGDSGGGNDMDSRLDKLETRIETILPMLATKGDISDAKYDIVKWLSAIILAVAAIGISVLLFALNRISPPQLPIQQPPIVVYPSQPSNPPTPQSPPETKRGR